MLVKSYVNYTFKNVYLVTPWNAIIDKQPGFDDEKPFYRASIIVHKKNEAFRELHAKLQDWQTTGHFSKIAKPVIHEMDPDKLSDEIVFLNEHNQDPNAFAYLTMKNKHDDPDRIPVLRSPQNKEILRVPENRKFFKRGTKVNVKATLGINKGQPYLILQGIQYVGPGFSADLPDIATPDFEIIDEQAPADMVLKISQIAESIGIAVTDDADDPVPF